MDDQTQTDLVAAVAMEDIRNAPWCRCEWTVLSLTHLIVAKRWQFAPSGSAWPYIFELGVSRRWAGEPSVGGRRRSRGWRGLRRAAARADDEGLAVVLDFSLAQGVELGDDLRSRAGASERSDAVLQRFLGHRRFGGMLGLDALEGPRGVE
jgi:hypothetical protein